MLLIDFDYTYGKRCSFLTQNHVMANLIRKTYTKLYQNQPRFVKDMTKTFWCVFRFTVLTAVHLQNANAKFTMQCCDIIQVSQKTFTLPYRKFIQNNVYRILSESTGFYRRYDKNIQVFLSVHSVVYMPILNLYFIIFAYCQFMWVY